MLLLQFPQHTVRFVHCKRTANLWVAMALNIIKLKRVGATEGVSLERPQVNKNGPSIPRQLEKVEKKKHLEKSQLDQSRAARKTQIGTKLRFIPFFFCPLQCFEGGKIAWAAAKTSWRPCRAAAELRPLLHQVEQIDDDEQTVRT